MKKTVSEIQNIWSTALAFAQDINEISKSYFTITELFLRADWSRAMVCESIDHENDAIMAKVVFLSFGRAIFQETSPETDIKNCQFYCKKQIDNINFAWLKSLYFYRP